MLNPGTPVTDFSRADCTTEHLNKNSGFEDDISLDEVKRAVRNAKSGKAAGIDELTIEMLRNPTCVTTLHKLFNVCYSSSHTPKMWSRGIINPIPKSSTADARDAMSNRGITLTPISYKLYCSVLNFRLTSWAESNDILSDNQNGFRKGRSTIDHATSLSNIIETRNFLRKSTFAAFIDFRRAFDGLDRGMMWSKLNEYGVCGRMLRAVKSLYTDVQCTVRVNRMHTEWFKVNNGVRQGCLLSPLLFNIYINDLLEKISAMGIGVKLDDDVIGILAYADDIVLLAETEDDLNILLSTLGEWCKMNRMSVNPDKSKVLHFRAKDK